MKLNYSYVIYIFVYILIFLVPYGVIPSYFIFSGDNPIANKLFELFIVSTIVYTISLSFDFLPPLQIRKISLDFDKIFLLFFSFFLLTSFVIVFTAPSIPLIDSLRGADAFELSEGREAFLKARKGVFSLLGYLIGFINSYFLPYLIILGLIRKNKYVYIVIALFSFYTILSLEKAYFLKLGIPLFFLYFYNAKNKFFFALKGATVLALIFALMFSLSRFTGSEADSNEVFFSILYTPQNGLEAFFWRSTIVPIVSALDGLRVFTYTFESGFFNGDTSSFIAYLKGSTHINFERYLYQFQFGGSETGNANQVYLVEAFINFGYFGVAIFTIFVAKYIKTSLDSDDVALKSILPLFLFHIYNAGLIAILLSNGLLFFILFLVFVKLK
ncbi:oligosaccharide repeat unit polymerase [Aquiflexum sp. TKW24L]|uniref:O-antigen polymerase n=1 Tax=Aquiflexum sp. TKW24L TaxID=2942212 RepID=UPI0020C00D13|nr:O-antigen polymerase [Aquiflexum sp. TKW24L]MCL6260013.1 oligosaccharide repeat unit polymerase [Aquiflexum sp. TKW24L]